MTCRHGVATRGELQPRPCVPAACKMTLLVLAAAVARSYDPEVGGVPAVRLTPIVAVPEGAGRHIGLAPDCRSSGKNATSRFPASLGKEQVAQVEVAASFVDGRF